MPDETLINSQTSTGSAPFKLFTKTQIIKFLTDDWEKYQGNQENFDSDSKILQGKIEGLMPLKPGDIFNLMVKVRTKALGMILGFKGEVEQAENKTDFAGWQQDEYLLYDLYFLIELFLNIKKDYLKIDEIVPKETLLSIVIHEIWITANAYSVRKIYGEILTSQLESERNEKLKEFIELFLNSILNNANLMEYEFCLPCGWKQHALYLTLLYDIKNNKLNIRIDNSAIKETKVFDALNLKDEIHRKDVSGYLTDVCCQLNSTDTIKPNKVVNNINNPPYNSLVFVKPEIHGYDNLPTQTGNNCVVEGYKRGRWYRFYSLDDTVKKVLIPWFSDIFVKAAAAKVNLYKPETIAALQRKLITNMLVDQKNLMEKLITEKPGFSETLREKTSKPAIDGYSGDQSHDIISSTRIIKKSKLFLTFTSVIFITVISYIVGLYKYLCEIFYGNEYSKKQKFYIEICKNYVSENNLYIRRQSYENFLCEFFSEYTYKVKIANLYGMKRSGIHTLVNEYSKKYKYFCSKISIGCQNNVFTLNATTFETFQESIKLILIELNTPHAHLIANPKEVFFNYLHEINGWLLIYDNYIEQESNFRLENNIPKNTNITSFAYRQLIITSNSKMQVLNEKNEFSILKSTHIDQFSFNDCVHFFRKAIEDSNYKQNKTYSLPELTISELVRQGLVKCFSLKDFKRLAHILVIENPRLDNIVFSTNATCAIFKDEELTSCILDSIEDYFRFIVKALENDLEHSAIEKTNIIAMFEAIIYLNPEVDQKVFLHIVDEMVFEYSKRLEPYKNDIIDFNNKMINRLKKYLLLESIDAKQNYYKISKTLQVYLSDRLEISRKAVVLANMLQICNVKMNWINSRSSMKDWETTYVYCPHAKIAINEYLKLNTYNNDLIELLDKIKLCSTKNEQLFFYEKGRNLAHNRSIYEYEIKFITRQIQFYTKYLTQLDLDKVILLDDDGKKLLPNINNYNEEWRFNNSIVRFYLHKGGFEKAFYLYHSNLRVVENNNYGLLPVIKNNLGLVYQRVGLIEKSYQIFYEKLTSLDNSQMNSSLSYLIAQININDLCVEYGNMLNCSNFFLPSNISVIKYKGLLSDGYSLRQVKESYSQYKYQESLLYANEAINLYEKDRNEDIIIDIDFSDALYIAGISSINLYSREQGYNYCLRALKVINRFENVSLLKIKILQCLLCSSTGIEHANFSKLLEESKTELLSLQSDFIDFENSISTEICLAPLEVSSNTNTEVPSFKLISSLLPDNLCSSNSASVRLDVSWHNIIIGFFLYPAVWQISQEATHYIWTISLSLVSSHRTKTMTISPEEKSSLIKRLEKLEVRAKTAYIDRIPYHKNYLRWQIEDLRDDIFSSKKTSFQKLKAALKDAEIEIEKYERRYPHQDRKPEPQRNGFFSGFTATLCNLINKRSASLIHSKAIILGLTRQASFNEANCNLTNNIQNLHL